MEGVITIGAAEDPSDFQRKSHLRSQQHSTPLKIPPLLSHEVAHREQLEQHQRRTPTPSAHGHRQEDCPQPHPFQNGQGYQHSQKSTGDSHSPRMSSPILLESDLFHDSDAKLKALHAELDQILEVNQRINQKLGRSLRRVRYLRREKSLLLDRLSSLGHCDSGSGTDNDESIGSGSRDSDSSSVPHGVRDRQITASQDFSRKALHTSTLAPNPEMKLGICDSEPSLGRSLRISNLEPSLNTDLHISNSEPRREMGHHIIDLEPSHEMGTRISNWRHNPKMDLRAGNIPPSREMATHSSNRRRNPVMDLHSDNSRSSQETSKGLFFRKMVNPGSSLILIKEFKPSELLPPTLVASAITNVGSAKQKPKRIHQPFTHRIDPSKSRKVLFLPRDENGSVKMPVKLGILTLWSTGYIVYDRETFHNERYIWPVGYRVSRLYNSMIDPLKKAIYMCSVIDDGNAPKFHVEANDQPGRPIIAGTATGAWTHIVKAANDIRKRDHTNAASGPDYYGFSNETIAMMIQQLPNAERCSRYVRRSYLEVPFRTTAKSESELPKPIPKPNPKPRKRHRGEDLTTKKTIEETGDIHGSGFVKDKVDVYTSIGPPDMKKQNGGPRWILPNEGSVEGKIGMVRDRRESDEGEVHSRIAHGSLVLEFPTKERQSI